MSADSETTKKCTCLLGLSTCGVETAAPLYPSNDSSKWIAIAYGVCVPIIVFFGIYAVIMFHVWARKSHKRDMNTDEFYTARASQGFWRITWAFFACSVGSWCIAAVPAFAVYTGIVGLTMYAIGSGLPALIICLCGAQVLRLHPNVVSIGDFAGKRFGPTVKLVVVLIVLFNMGCYHLGFTSLVGMLRSYPFYRIKLKLASGSRMFLHPQVTL